MQTISHEWSALFYITKACFLSYFEEKASKIWLIPKKGVSLHFRSLM